MDRLLLTLISLFLTAQFIVIGWFLFRLQVSMTRLDNRLSGELKDMKDSVVFTDVFEQHEKIDETRYAALTRQLDQLGQANETNLGRIEKGMDRLVDALLNPDTKVRS